MNFKRNCKFITALIACVLVLTSCGKNKSFNRYTFIDEITDLHQDETFLEGSSRIGNYKPYFTNISSEGNVNRNVFTEKGLKNLLKTTGDQKILVIPVEFPDYKCEEKLGISKKQYIDTLNRAFFGVQENTSYYSVSEYYNISSFGKLRISGEVSDQFYEFKVTSESLKNASQSTLFTYYQDIINWYISLGKDISSFKIDPNKEAVDSNVAIYLVYDRPYDENATSDSFFWAYTFSSSPFSWTSFSFIGSNLNKPDTHTFIHETGHLLGLEDYYPQDSSKDEPTHRIDMMDASLGDHTGFSKMFMDWVRPIEVTKTCEISINSFTSSGDLLLISPSWNKTVFDEYYLLELYTPTGLNKKDSILGNTIAKLPSLSGIKIYHVDARLAYYKNNRQGLEYISDCEFNTEANVGDAVGFINSNNKPLTSPLYELILNEKIIGDDYASDRQLFHLDNTFNDFKFNQDLGGFSCSIKVKNLGYKNATLSIEFN